MTWYTIHVGRRGAFLLFLGLLDFVYAWALRLEDTPQQVIKPDFFLPWQALAIWWLATGVIATIGAFSQKDVWAFFFAALLKGSWASASLALWLRGEQPDGWLPAAVWATLAGTILVVASWPETPPPEGGRIDGDIEIEVPHAHE
ncbi:MAG: hypothetical protein ACRDOK_16575 [Streptosporangiaceae bacterium]